MSKLDREIYRLQTGSLIDQAADDPRLRLLVASDLTWTGLRPAGLDLSEAAEAIADIAEYYELDTDDINATIELCRHALIREAAQRKAG